MNKKALNYAKISFQQKNQAEERFKIISWGHWFALFNILFTIILASRYLFIMDWPTTLGGRIYAIISLFGHFSFLVFLIYLLGIFPLSFILRNPKTIRIIAISIATIGLTVMLVDQQVYKSVNLHLNALVWSLLIEPSYNVSTHEWQRFFALMPIIFLVQLLFGNWSWLKLRSLQRQRWVKWLSTLFISCFMATHFVFAWADANFYRPITMQKANYPLSYPMTARSFLSQYGFLDEVTYQSKLIEEGDPTLHKVTYPLTPLSLESNASDYSIVLIVFDELTDDVINQVPALKTFKERNYSFNNHYSFSEPFFTLEYGISPIYQEAITRDNLPSLFPQVLTQRGYHSFHYDVGFKEQTPALRFGQQPTLISSLNKLMSTLDQDIFKKSVVLSSDNRQKEAPFFITMLLSSQKVLSSPKKWQELLAKLENFNDNTLIIITAKHSSTILNDNYIPLNVPMLLKWPEVTLNVPVDKITTHQDIALTVLKRALRVSNLTNDYSQGEDLFNSAQQNRFWVDGNVNTMVVKSPEGSVTLNAKSVRLYHKKTEEITEISVNDPTAVANQKISSDPEFQKKQFGLVLQALFDLQRFWSD